MESPRVCWGMIVGLSRRYDYGFDIIQMLTALFRNRRIRGIPARSPIEKISNGKPLLALLTNLVRSIVRRLKRLALHIELRLWLAGQVTTPSQLSTVPRVPTKLNKIRTQRIVALF
jgi:hypothetical protein